MDSLKILITGSSGLIGSALCAFLSTKGHVLYRLIRGTPSSPYDIFWNPEKYVIDALKIDGIDAVIHLAGKSIADQRWTPAVKKEILSSRILGTTLLSQSLTLLPRPPKVLISASAVGYYGNRPYESMSQPEGSDGKDSNNETITETSGPGIDFLAEICQQWEAATSTATEFGIRTVITRIGIVLSKHGGALQKMLLPFRLGLGGVTGSGNQGMSWITLDDLLEGILHCILTKEISGPVNLVSPNPVSNREFTKILGKVLHRPTFCSLPAWTVKAIFGEMGDALLLSGVRAIPEKLQNSGYQFLWPELETALQHELGIETVQRYPE